MVWAFPSEGAAGSFVPCELARKKEATLTGILDRVRMEFRAIAGTIVPEAASIDEAGWSAVEAIIHEALARRPPAMQRQLVAFIRLLTLMPVVRYGRSFGRLSAERRVRVLTAVERSPVALLRRGFWGLRTLVFMGYYARPGVARELGYRGDARGWSVRPRVATAPPPPR